MFNVHEYTIDRAKGVAKIGKTNPARTYVKGEKDADGVMQVKYTTVQLKDGELYYWDEGGMPADRTLIDQYILKDLAKSPLRVGIEKVEQTIKFCPYCPPPDNAMGSNAFEGHLLEHLVTAGVQPVKPTQPEPKAKAKKAA